MNKIFSYFWISSSLCKGSELQTVIYCPNSHLSNSIQRTIVRYATLSASVFKCIITSEALRTCCLVFFPLEYYNEDSGLSRSVSMATGLNLTDKRPKVRTIFPHKSGNNQTLLSFEEGDIITLLIPDERDGWLYGELQNTKQWVQLVSFIGAARRLTSEFSLS